MKNFIIPLYTFFGIGFLAGMDASSKPCKEIAHTIGYINLDIQALPTIMTSLAEIEYLKDIKKKTLDQNAKENIRHRLAERNLLLKKEFIDEYSISPAGIVNWVQRKQEEGFTVLISGHTFYRPLIKLLVKPKIDLSTSTKKLPRSYVKTYSCDESGAQCSVISSEHNAALELHQNIIIEDSFSGTVKCKHGIFTHCPSLEIDHEVEEFAHHCNNHICNIVPVSFIGAYGDKQDVPRSTYRSICKLGEYRILPASN